MIDDKDFKVCGYVSSKTEQKMVREIMQLHLFNERIHDAVRKLRGEE